MTRQVQHFSSFANQLQILLLQCAKQVSNTKVEADEISFKLRDEMRSLKYFETLEESYRKKIGEFDDSFLQHMELFISSTTLETKQKCFHSRSSLLQLIDSIIKDIRSDLPADSIPLRQYQERFGLLVRDYGWVNPEPVAQLEKLGTVDSTLVRSGLLFLLSAEKFLILNNQYVFSCHGVHFFSKYNALCGELLNLSDHKEVENLEDSIAAIDRTFLFWHGSHYWDLIELDEKKENVDEFVQDIRIMLTLNHEERLA